MSDLQLFLHRRNADERDDEIRIWRRPGDTFLLHYTEGEWGRVYSHVYTKEGFRGYIWTLLYLLTIDSDPFQYLQVNGIGFPNVLVRLSEFDPSTPTWTAVHTVISSFIDGHWSIRSRTVPTREGRTASRGEPLSRSTPDSTE